MERTVIHILMMDWPSIAMIISGSQRSSPANWGKPFQGSAVPVGKTWYFGKGRMGNGVNEFGGIFSDAGCSAIIEKRPVCIKLSN
jgi:hypothetical protein